MNQKLVKQSALELDGFDGGGGEGRDDEQSIIKGLRIKYGDATRRTTWLADGEPLPQGLLLVAIDMLRVLQKWPPASTAGDNDPPETRILEPDEKWPDTEALNAEVPKSEWRTGPNGEPKGPYENARILYLLNPTTVKRFTYVASTIGGMRATADLRDRVAWMRRLKGERVFAEVEFSSTHMPTRFGGTMRPAFNITRWVTFDDNGEVLPAVESSQLASPSKPTPEPESDPTRASARAALRKLKTVAEPSLSDETDDEIKF